MRARHIDRGGAPALPLNLLARAVPMLSRHALASLTERLIDELEAVDVDADCDDEEPDGWELDYL